MVAVTLEFRNFFASGHSSASRTPDTTTNSVICSHTGAPSAAHSSATSAPSANHMETRWIGQAASAIRNTTSSTSQKKAADFIS